MQLKHVSSFLLVCLLAACSQESSNSAVNDDAENSADSPLEEDAEPVAKEGPNYKGIYKTGASEGIEQAVRLYHAETHGLNVSYYEDPKTWDYMDLWLSKVLLKVFAEFRHKYGVTAVEHMGIYNYRKVAGTETMSRHSFALAIDFRGFRFADGSRLTLKDDWSNEAGGPILKAMRDDLCKYFHVVLSPEYNAAHADHFHVDLDPATRQADDTEKPFWDDIDWVPQPVALMPETAFGPQREVNDGDEGLSLRSNSLLLLENRTCS